MFKSFIRIIYQWLNHRVIVQYHVNRNSLISGKAIGQVYPERPIFYNLCNIILKLLTLVIINAHLVSKIFKTQIYVILSLLRRSSSSLFCEFISHFIKIYVHISEFIHSDDRMIYKCENCPNIVISTLLETLSIYFKNWV